MRRQHDSAAPPAIRTSDLGRRFGDEIAITELDLSVPAGSIFGLIGPSGSGKTTAVRMITGALAPSSGTVEVFGRAPHAFGPRDRMRIGYMPQLSVLYPHLSLLENLRFTASIYGLSPWRRGRLHDALRRVELLEHRHKLLRDASGGMQRRLALAAALLHDPELVVLDEPTAGIDPVLRRSLWEHFTDLRDRGRTLLVTTQYVAEAEYCDRVALVSDGRLVALDTPEGLRREAVGGELVAAVCTAPVGDGAIADLSRTHGVLGVEREGTEGRALVVRVEDADLAIPRLQEHFTGAGLALESVEPRVPPFDDVFVTLVAAARAEA